MAHIPAPPNYPIRGPKYHLIDTIRPLIEVPKVRGLGKDPKEDP